VLLKDSIPVLTWAEGNDAGPGFVEIDLVGHEGGNSSGEFWFTLDVTDIVTGWTETRPVRNTAQKWVFAAIKDLTASSRSRSWESTLATHRSSSTGSCFAGASGTR